MRALRGRWWDAALALWYAGVVLFLFAPIVVALVYSFNTGVVNKQTATWTGFTWAWFPAAWHDLSLRRAVWQSVVVACWTAAISLLMGSALGYALARHPSRAARRALAGLTYALLIVPESVIGVSLLLFYAETGIPLSMATLIAGITPLTLAVVALIVRARVLTLDRRIEEAAADLGSPRLTTLRLIVLPQMLPAMLAGGVMAYAFAFDNLVVATFLTTPRVNTLPVYLYGSLQYGPSPAVYAAASAVFLFTLALLGIAALIHRSSRRPFLSRGR